MIHKNWQELIKPTQLDVKPGNDPARQATMIAEPLERGFGLTLGNALRRVLMSSLQGAAITSVQIDNLSKCYQLGVTHAHTLREVGRQAYRSLASCLLGRRKAAMPLGESPSTLWALKDLSLQVKQGETLAVIGPNGGGKSTLLKILSRITLPSKGTVEVFGLFVAENL